MRLFWLCFLATTFAALSACDTESSVPLGGGGACVPASPPSGSCTPTMQCVLAGTLNWCGCEPGSEILSCGGFGGAAAQEAISLVTSQPKDGTCCDADGLVCGGFGICTPICRCEHGKWSCKEPDCPLFFCPDPVTQLEGVPCDDRIGDVCSGVAKGCSLFCGCRLDALSGHGMWECAEPNCSVDAGVGEAGPPFDAGPFDAGEPIEGGTP